MNHRYKKFSFVIFLLFSMHKIEAQTVNPLKKTIHSTENGYLSVQWTQGSPFFSQPSSTQQWLNNTTNAVTALHYGDAYRKNTQGAPQHRPCRAIIPNMPHGKFPGYPHPGRFAVTPPEAQVAGIATGCANVMFQLNRDGRPINAHVVSEEPVGHGFGEAAVESLQGDQFNSAPHDSSWYGLLVQVQP